MLERRIVSDSEGGVTETGMGTIQTKNNNLYVFFAVKVSDTGIDKKEINMVLPVGGSASGLYRFPRVGESVLVDCAQDGQYYLLGYLPSDTSSDSFIPNPVAAANKLKEEKDKLLEDQQGMILRYRQTGKTNPGENEKYSEIGFYHQDTSWKPSRPEDYKDINKDKYPRIDRINIQSTGDIHAEAQNHYQTKAKRFELLVNCDEVDHTSDKLAFEDMPGDDPALYAGDAHIRAKNRIVIKAGDEIILEAGRSTIRINDSGITLSSRKVKGNFENPWNTVLSLTPRDGINMSGQHLKMRAVFDFSLADGMGAKLSGLCGVVRLLGKDIKAKTLSTIKYLGQGATAVSQFGIAVDAMRSGMLTRFHGDVHTGYDNTRRMAGKGVDVCMPILSAIINAKRDDSLVGDPDPIEWFMMTLEILLTLTAVSCGVIAETVIEKKLLKDNIRDQINLSQMVVETSFILAAVCLLCNGWSISWAHAATVQLSGNANISENCLRHELTSTNSETAVAPLAGLVDNLVNDVIKKLKDTETSTKVIFGVAGSILAIGVGVGAGIGMYKGTTNAEGKNQDILNKLEEL